MVIDELEIKKEIITSKKQINFYKECYEKINYKLDEIKKIDGNYVLSFIGVKNEILRDYQEEMEKKLRIIEITDRKIRRFNSLYINLFINLTLFCLQAIILFNLNMTKAHPEIMLRVGIILLQIFLFATLIFKAVEIFRWKKTIQKMKTNIFKQSISKKQENLKIISVLFTRNHAWISEIIYWCSGRQFTHSSIGLEEKPEEFYSFDYRGFRKEHPAHRKLKNGNKQSVCYQFKVSEEEYQKVKNIIEQNIEQQKDYKYNYIGVVLSTLHIYMPIKSKRVYFCSELVSNILKQLPSFKIKKTANMYLPTNLAKELILQDNLYKVLVNEV